MAKKTLYNYQQNDIEQIIDRLKNKPPGYNLLYQLPTGGGKTVIFSEIVRQYLEFSGKKALILTHRIELCKQTSDMLSEFDVKNKVIESKVKSLPDEKKFQCFVAMVETLNNRLKGEEIEIKNLGLIIIDEAHYNSFRKLFKFFDNCFMIGVTATPLSSNIKLPMKDVYNELICGAPIKTLVKGGFLAQANTFTYNVHLGGLKMGINGDYTVKSSDLLYSKAIMQNKLLRAYEEKALGKKTLIFNAGIASSESVHKLFTDAGYEIRHLDSTHNSVLRQETLTWFRTKKNAILTSVGILTTGFDEPTVQTIILNRATKSLTLYFQMIGRGSRILPNKKDFDVIDLGNNSTRFGLWEEKMDWHYIFNQPDFFIESIMSDAEIEKHFVYEMPDELRAHFSKSAEIDFDVKEEFDKVKGSGMRSAVVIDKSIEQHANMCVDNSEDFDGAIELSVLLKEDIADRIRRYSYCISKSTKNYIEFLKEDYTRKLRRAIKIANAERA